MSDGPYERSGMSDRPVSDRPVSDGPYTEIISMVMAEQQILTPKIFLYSLAAEQFLHVKYFKFYSQRMIVKNLSENPL